MLKEAIATLVDELAGMVEPTRAGALRRAPFVVVEQGSDYELYRVDRRGPRLLANGRLDKLTGEDLPRAMRRRPVELRLDNRRLLTKTLQLPAASRNYLDAIVTHQLERMTPWSADRVAFDYELAPEEDDKDHINVRVVATSREMVEGAVERLTAIGAQPLVVGTSADPLERPSPINLMADHRLDRRNRLRRRVSMGLVVVVAIVAAASVFSGWRLYVTNAEAASVETELNATRQKIEALRTNAEASEVYARLLARKKTAVPMVVLIDRLSAIIPADTYLTGLQVDGEELRVTGSSTDAPGLIETMEAADILSEVRFAAPTTRDEAAGRDRFEIVARVLPVEAPTQ